MKYTILTACTLAAVSSGCVGSSPPPSSPGGPEWTYTATGDPHAALAATCPVKLYLTLPTRSYDEIGVVDWTGPDDPGPPHDPNAMLAAVTPMVCSAGGNAIIAMNQGSNTSWFSYPQAIVISVASAP